MDDDGETRTKEIREAETQTIVENLLSGENLCHDEDGDLRHHEVPIPNQGTMTRPENQGACEGRNSRSHLDVDRGACQINPVVAGKLD